MTLISLLFFTWHMAIVEFSYCFNKLCRLFYLNHFMYLSCYKGRFFLVIFEFVNFRNSSLLCRELSSKNVEVCLLLRIYLLFCFNRAIEIEEDLLQYSPSKLNMAYRHYLQEYTMKDDSDCFLTGEIDEEIDFEGDLRFVFLFSFIATDTEGYSGACPTVVVEPF